MKKEVASKLKTESPLEIKRELFFYKKPTKRRQKIKTIAGIYLSDGRILFGKSECSLNDQFNRKKGRAIAKARALSLSKVTLVQANVIDEMKLTEQFISIAKDL